MTAGCNMPRASDAASAPEAALRLEKPRQSANTGERGHAFRERRGPKPTRRQAYHFETGSGSPWNGPMLQPTYAAQVIAQALEAGDGASTRSAYGRTRVAAPLLFDETL